MLTHNTYFDDAVQSVGFERNGRSMSVGVIDTGEFHFGTAAPERMTVVSGELAIKRDGETEWTTYPAGTAFEVVGDSGFDVRAAAPAAYLCEYL